MFKELKEWHEEELADEQKYMEMSKVAPEEYKSIFRDISREEGSHARILDMILKDYKEHCECDEENSENHTEENSEKQTEDKSENKNEETKADEIKPTGNRVVLV